ncbi:MAG: DUF1987 domain-containing protein [Bacteroidota bacterium]
MQDPFIHLAAEDVPSIRLDAGSGVFEISGRSLPEDAAGFYGPAISWMLDYSRSPNKETVFVFRLEYFNTASAKQLFKIMNILQEIAKTSSVKVKWYYDKGDRDMLASGERYVRLTGLDFDLAEN